MKKDVNIQNQGFRSLIPFLVFFGIYLVSGFVCQSLGMEKAFNQVPTSACAFFGLFTALFVVKGKFSDKFKWIMGGVGKPDVAIVIVICILLGGFSVVAKASGGVESIVGICMVYVPKSIITAAFFITASLIAFASSSSLLAIVSVTPVALEVALASNISVPVIVGSIMGAAVFGNTLNPISDCTTVSNSITGIMGKAGQDKMIALAKMYAIPWIVTVILLLIVGRPQGAVQVEATYNINLWTILPYALTLALALIGFNFVVSLSCGIISGMIIGLALGKFDLLTAVSTLVTGFNDNANMTWMFVFVSGIVGIALATGGIQWIIDVLSKLVHGPKSAQIIIWLLGCVTTLCIGNNAIPSLAIGDIVNDLGKKYRIDPRRLSTLLACSIGFVVAIIPHSGIGLNMSGLIESSGASSNFIQGVPMNFFVLLAMVMTIVTIFVPFSEKHYAKDPWNFETNCLESEVDKEK